MSARNNSNGGGGGSNSTPPGVNRPVTDTIDFIYDHSVEGDLDPYEEIRGDDFTEIVGEHKTDSDEVMEVFKLGLLPPVENGELQTSEFIRLWDGDAYYPHLRYREFMMGFESPNLHLTTPRLGTPVLSGEVNPASNIFESSVPKFGTSTPVSPAYKNDDTPVTDSFRLRLWVVRWSGTEAELQEYFNSQFGRTTFQQNVTMSNPYKGTSETYQRNDPVQIQAGGGSSAHGEFTQLAGGVAQSQPKVFPWVTWTTNNQATRANKSYEFTMNGNRVASDYQQLEFDYTNRKKAAIFQHLQVNQADNLQEGSLALDSRDGMDPTFQLAPNSAHQLPLVRPLDGTIYEREDLPVNLAEDYDVQVIWDDGGGFRITDDGNSIPAGEVLVGVQGRKLELSS